MRKFRIKPYHNVLRKGNNLLFGGYQFGISNIVEDNDNGDLWKLAKYLKDFSTLEELKVKMKEIISPDSIEEIIQSLNERGHLEFEDYRFSTKLSPKEVDRYSRNINYFSWVDNRGISPYFIQEKIIKSSVIILGAGGIGSAIASSLVALGVGKIRIIDFDKVEYSNLNRQIMYTEEDVGSFKVKVLKDRLSLINKNCDIECLTMQINTIDDLNSLNITEDLLILSIDTPEGILSTTNKFCYTKSIPFISAAYAGPMCVVSTFDPNTDTPCYDCLIKSYLNSKEKPEHNLYDEHQNAVIAPASLIAANYGALEAYRVLTKNEPYCLGKIFHANYIKYDHSYFIYGNKYEACPCCNKRK